MSAELILIGGGGHCRSCIDVIEAEGAYRIAGFLDPDPDAATVSGYPRLGDDSRIGPLSAAGNAFLVTVGQVKSPRARLKVLEILRAAGASLATVVAPSATVSRLATIGKGTVVMHQSLINAGAAVGGNCIINSRALIEHDASVGETCHVSTAAIVNGGARIGDRTFLGSGCVVAHGVSVGADCVVGAGAVVVRDLPGGGTYAGVPARRIA